ncbi:MAG: hypothetical protein H6741_05760 [Alphaproteobacteria bacterium]|nr:hypothetical protein [Alphaproteobacteria bacterium]MCB9792213.1 hypothetical protein [Alphaproteobacteria bacterium]
MRLDPRAVRWSLLLALPLGLAGCGWEAALGVCCVITLLPMVLVVLSSLERKVVGLGSGLAAVGILSIPFLTWDQLDNPILAQMGGWMVIMTDMITHDLMAALLPQQPWRVRALLGALLLGGGGGAVVGLINVLTDRKRVVMGCLGVPLLGAMALASLRLGPSLLTFAPHAGGEWPALEELDRPSPVPARWVEVEADDGKVLRRTYPPLSMLHLLPKPLSGDGGCPVTLTHELQVMTVDISRGVWAAVLGDPSPDASGSRRTGMKWFEAAGFANRLSEARGLKPAYLIQPGQVAWDSDSQGFRLPTRAELALAQVLAPEIAPEDPVWTWDSWDEAAPLGCGVNPGMPQPADRFMMVETTLQHGVWSPSGVSAADADAVDPAIGLRLVRWSGALKNR